MFVNVMILFPDHCGLGKEYRVWSIGEACIQCQLGTYKDTVGNEACTPCQPGYTSIETGQASCDICKFVVVLIHYKSKACAWCADLSKCQAIKGHNQRLASTPTDLMLLLYIFMMIVSIVYIPEIGFCQKN